MNMMHKQSGITLVEIMTVIAVAAVMASIAIPSIVGWLPKYRMISAGDELLSTLQACRIRAVRENDNVSISFIFGDNSYTAFVDSANIGSRDAGERIVKTGQMPPGIDLQNDTLGNLVVFNSRGFPTSDGIAPLQGNIVVSNGSQTRTISLTLAGTSSVQ
jgi:type IV fimbrial biogenesis protein FimT